MELNHKRLWLFDFDGVIKDSNDVKRDIFACLFSDCGDDVVKKISSHHLDNPHVSREAKIRLYLQYAGLKINDERVAELVEAFGSLSKELVPKADWIPGVIDFIIRVKKESKVGIISAMPRSELEILIASLGMSGFIDFFSGYPCSKQEGIKSAMRDLRVAPGAVLFFGDARSDFAAATSVGIDFCLVRNSSNLSLENECSLVISDFTNIELT